MNALRGLVQTIRTRKLVAAFISIIVVGGMGLVWLHQVNYGVGVSPDAIHYLSVAENLSIGRGFTGLHGGKFSMPPLFEFLVTLGISLTAENGVVVARYVNIGCFGLIIITVLAWLSPKVHSKFWLVWAGAICALSPALIHISLFAQNDSIHVLFAILSLYELDKWLIRSKKSSLILAATYASLSSLSRYTGFAVILTAILMISLKRGIIFRTKARYITIYLLISALPSAIWMLRNFFKIGRLTHAYWGESDFRSTLFGYKWELIKMIIGDLGDHYLWLTSQTFGITVASMRDYFLIFLAATLGVGIIYISRQKMGGGVTVPLVYILVYILFLSASFVFGIAEVEPRYLTPIYVPLMVVTVIVFDGSLKIFAQSERRSRTSKGVGLLIAVGLIILLVPPTIKKIGLWQESGISYASKTWTESETTRYVTSNPVSGIIYSNYSKVLFTHLDISDKVNISFRQLHRSFSDNDYHTWDDRDYRWRDENHSDKIDHNREIDRHVIWYTSKFSAINPPYDFLTIASLSELKIALILEDGVVLADEGLEPASALDAVLKDAKLVVRSEFDIYLGNSRIIYLADPCIINSDTLFFLHIVPADPDDLPDQPEASDVVFDNHDFDFERDGFRFGERCAAIRNLPDYDIDVIRTGQYDSQGDVLWKEEIHDLRLASRRSD